MVQMMNNTLKFRDTKRKLDFNDVLIVPKKSSIHSRSLPTIERKFHFKTEPQSMSWTGIPIVSSNMTSVTGLETFDVLRQQNYISCFPKHFNKDWMEAHTLPSELQFINHYMLSCGINDHDYKLVISLIDRLKDNDINVKFLCVDIANGYLTQMLEVCSILREKYPRLIITAGNVVTPEATFDLIKNGVNIVKIGIGSGCFSEDTKVLMANGLYKNINEIKIGEYVINKDGKAVKVLNVMNQGKKEVLKVSTNNWHEDIYVTRDHRYWIGDLSNSSMNTVQSAGIAKQLDKVAKTKPKSSKYKWKAIDEINNENMFCLMPKDIEWNLPDNFKIDLACFNIRGKVSDIDIITNGNISQPFNRYTESCYELGYLFGTFLGDGTSAISTNNNCEQGSCNWSFGLNEDDIANKVKDYISKLFGYDCSITIKSGNMLVVNCYNKCLSKMFNKFGKRTNKSLPTEYYCTNKEYIQGLFDGLVDSDGSIEVNKSGTENKSFNNTSTSLIELYNWCCMNLNISFCSVKKPKSIGNLEGTCIENLQQCYRVKTHTLNRFTKDYVYSVLQRKEVYGVRDTWDIEVDCPTHSFIANNSIVHNSACTTRLKTGVGYPQLSALLECADVAHHHDGFTMSDGGIVHPADIVKAYVAGADFVMVGSMFAGHSECPGELQLDPRDNHWYKVFFGMSSETALKEYNGGMKNYRSAEGKTVKIKHRGKLANTILDINGGLRSACTYTNSSTLEELYENGEFILVSRTHNTYYS
jgi:IMP dehydrogenase/GMP reductase